MKYIRTKDNKVFDLEKIKKDLKKNSAYPHLYDWKLEPTNDSRGSLRLSWMADFKGSKSKPEKLKTPRECAVILDCDSSEYKQADNVDDLIRDDDMLYIHDLYPDAVLVVEGNIKPFGYNDKIKLKDWLKYNDSFDLYIRNDRDNYILAAKRNDKGNWTVIDDFEESL